MEDYGKLAIHSADQLIFGHCPRPLRLRNGLVIGGGTVYPELNFTLPPMEVTKDTMAEVRGIYTEIADDACRRAVQLHTPGLVIEFETLPQMTLNPEWAAEITAILRTALDRFAQSDGLRGALRVTPNDVRENERPPRMRGGHLLESMLRAFELCAAAGADLLAIESTGGKEIHDDAILNVDLAASVFALGVLGSRDMAFLWERIAEIARRYGAVPSGDSACGFGNTAMILAERNYIPRVWAALIRVMTVARTLVAHEHGAVGPVKDCAYEGPYIKAITGYPISLEGAEAACAHFSAVGNIAKATADLWSNESVQNVRLLAGMAPTVSLEQLVYATRLMNAATARGPEAARTLRDLFVDSDSRFDPQAYVLRPDVVVDLAREIIAEPTPYLRTRRAALAALERLRKAYAKGDFDLPSNEMVWLDRLSAQAEDLPETEEEMIDAMLKTVDRAKVRTEEYEIGVPETAAR